jgi:predicted GNAT superfamily acetyltransferase
MAEPFDSLSATGGPRPGVQTIAHDVTGLVVRSLSSHRDYEQAVELQRITWGATFRDIVPAAILKVTQRIGGVTAGAFGPDGAMYGFVYGLTGYYDGRMVHWSHMLGVRPEWRDHGIGQRLKEFQRELLHQAGIDWIYWTFDPLVARNAHLNFNRLGVQVREYVPDMYGDTGSELHAFGTDRFVVAWAVNGAGPSERLSLIDESELSAAPLLNRLRGDGLAEALSPVQNPIVLVEVPEDIEKQTVAEARAWREVTRRSILAALKAGYQVEGFLRDRDDRCLYFLSA